MRRAPIVLVTLLASGRLAFGCSSDASAPHATDAGQDVLVIAVDAAPDRPEPVDAAIPDPPLPPGLPEGWVLDRTYANYCSFYVPKSKDKLPPPIQWARAPPRNDVTRRRRRRTGLR